MTLAPLAGTLRPLGVKSGSPPTYISRLIAAGATGIWPMQEASGAPQDVSGGGRHMSVTGALTYRQAGPGGSLPYALAGWSALNYMQSSDAAFKGTGAFTVGVWFYSGSIGTLQMPFDRDGITATRVWFTGLNILAGTQFAGRLVSTLTDAIGGTANSPNTWYFFCARFTPSTEWAVFRNGSKDGFTTTSIPASIPSSAAALGFGAALNGQFACASGRLAGGFFAPSALADDVIAALYHSGVPE